MTILFAALIGSLLTLSTGGTISYEDCKARNFEPQACKTSKVMHSLGPKEKDDSQEKYASN